MRKAPQPDADLRELHFSTAFEGFKPEIERLIREHGARAVCEIGGGRSPLFGAAEIAAMGVDYTVLDVSQAELDLAPPEVRTVCRDIGAPVPAADESAYDLMFSKFLAEHVRSARTLHGNVLRMLRPGGLAFHFFPTLYYPVYLVNRLIPMRLTTAVAESVLGYTSKFPAYYSGCYGPTPRARAFFESLGYEIVLYRPFYGSGYFQHFPVVRGAEHAASAWAARRGSARLSSYAYLVLRRPGGRPAAARASSPPGTPAR